MSRGRGFGASHSNTGALPPLSDDLMAHILVASLGDPYRRVAALVCRRWRRIISAHAGPDAALRIDPQTQGLLAADGCLDILLWLSERIPRGDAHWHPIVRGAAAGGHTAIIDWAASEVPRTYLDEALPFAAAASSGRIDTIKALQQRGHRDLSGALACTSAVMNGHLRCATWLLSRGAALDYRAACEHAAATGDINALVWLRALAIDGADDTLYEWDPVGLMALAPPQHRVSAWLLRCARGANVDRARRNRIARAAHQSSGAPHA
jgi:hypothetical protein